MSIFGGGRRIRVQIRCSLVPLKAVNTRSKSRYTQRYRFGTGDKHITKTRRERILGGSVAASLLLTVVANMFVSLTFIDRQFGISVKIGFRRGDENRYFV